MDTNSDGHGKNSEPQTGRRFANRKERKDRKEGHTSKGSLNRGLRGFLSRRPSLVRIRGIRVIRG
jgi:hypothetical protein